MIVNRSQEYLLSVLQELRKLPQETEWVEFKEAKKNYNFDEIGKYFSALSNEANLKNQPCGWLIFGVVNADRSICGSDYRNNATKLGNLKHEIARQTGGITFVEIHVVNHPNGRVVMFEIPPAAKGIPVSFNGHWYGRDGESLVALALHKLEQIRAQAAVVDWSAQMIMGESLDRLDPEAIRKARTEYKVKHRTATFYDEIDEWDDPTFLNKARLTIDGVLTNAAVILLGKPESVHLIQPSLARLTWILRNHDDNEIDYAHFDPPFLLNVDRLFIKVRNLNLRELPDGTLFPVEISQYDPWVMREALHNCIAHQDYRLCSRINLIEKPDSLLFVNAGTFFPGSVEAVLTQDAPPRYYPNRLLTETMVNLNMIDTIGSGIKRMFTTQKNRYMPMPDYDLSKHNEVHVTLPGRVLDENYTKLLIKRTDLPLDHVILLDRIQKRGRVSKDHAKLLRRDKLVEGRYPNLYVAAHVASATGNRVQYIKNRAFDDAHYKNMILKYLDRYGHATRKDLESLVLDKLSDVLDNGQKRNKLTNLIQAMSAAGQIQNFGSRKFPKWKRVL